MPVPIKEVESLSNNDKVPLSEQMRTLINPHKIRILCLDDNTEILKFLRNSLSKDYYVITHQDGSEVLEVLEEINPQLIISDVNMPIMDGLEFLKSVRKINQYKTTPFIFLTGSASEETEVLGFASGADSILHKPIQLQSLLTKIRRTLDQKEAIKTETTKFFAQKILPGLLQDDDQMLLKTLEEVILSNIQDSQLKSSDIAEQIGMGEKTLRNKVKNLTGMTVKEYLRLVRLETAKKLVYQEYGTYGEIATAVGFSSLSYFRKSYKSYFKDAERNNSLDVP
jgi:CheY-like chemotaxis protein